MINQEKRQIQGCGRILEKRDIREEQHIRDIQGIREERDIQEICKFRIVWESGETEHWVETATSGFSRPTVLVIQGPHS